MKFIIDALSFLDEYTIPLSFLIVIATGFWSVIKFREHVRDKRFETYHKLIDWLVNEQIEPDKKIKLDRQIAVVYELRNFPKYFDVSKRIMRGLLEDWKDGDARIKKEIELSLAYMENNWIIRKFKKSVKNKRVS